MPILSYSRGPIVLLTDFGTADGYVGVMKGVISGIAPRIPVLDLSHAIAPQSVLAARFVLWNSYRYFPSGSTFVAVVDPGVGSARDIWLLETENHRFLAPDNGLLEWVMAEVPVRNLYAVRQEKWMRKTISYTFHGRDIFAPVAAHLTQGVLPEAMGPRLDIPDIPSPFKQVERGMSAQGALLHIDHFGNAISNIRLAAGWSGEVEIAGRRLELKRTYAEVAFQETLALVGSHGLLECAQRAGNLARTFSLSPGSPLSLHPDPA